MSCGDIPGLPVRWCMCRETQPLRRRNAPLYRIGTPQHHFCGPGDGGCHSNRPFSWVVRWRGAVSWRNRKTGRNERNAKETVLFPPGNQPWGPNSAYDARLCPWHGSDGVNWPFLRCATAVSLPASAWPSPVTTHARAPSTRPAFSFCSAVWGWPAWAALRSGWLKTHLCLKNPRQPFGPTILTQRLKTKSTRSLLAYESAR